MKTKLLLPFLALAALLAAGAAALTSTTTLKRIQTDPATGRAQAFFATTVTVDGATYAQPWKQYDFGIGATDKTVTVNGKTYTDAEVFEIGRAHV